MTHHHPSTLSASHFQLLPVPTIYPRQLFIYLFLQACWHWLVSVIHSEDTKENGFLASHLVGPLDRQEENLTSIASMFSPHRVLCIFLVKCDVGCWFSSRLPNLHSFTWIFSLLCNRLKTYDQNLYNSRLISFLALCAVVLAHAEKRKENWRDFWHSSSNGT